MAQASPGLTGPRVLVVMDDPLAKVLEVVLRHGRYQSHVTADRAEFSRLLSTWAPHVVLLDLDLHPTFLELSQSGPNKAVPTLVFTRRRDTALKLRAFEHGAEDILRIPFLLSEIVARLYAVVRRTQGIEVPLLPRIRVDSVEVDLIEDRLHVDDRDPISLTLTESTLLYLLAAITFVASIVPTFIGGITLAWLADRHPRRGVMIACDLIRCALVLIMVIPGVPLAGLVALLFLVTLVSAPFTSARAAIYPDVLAGDRYVMGVAVTITTYQFAQVIGFAAGGAIVGTRFASVMPPLRKKSSRRPRSGNSRSSASRTPQRSRHTAMARSGAAVYTTT